MTKRERLTLDDLENKDPQGRSSITSAKPIDWSKVRQTYSNITTSAPLEASVDYASGLDEIARGISAWAEEDRKKPPAAAIPSTQRGNGGPERAAIANSPSRAYSPADYVFLGNAAMDHFDPQKAAYDEEKQADFTTRFENKMESRPKSMWMDHGWYDSNGILHANRINNDGGWLAPDDRTDYIISQYLGNPSFNLSPNKGSARFEENEDLTSLAGMLAHYNRDFYGDLAAKAGDNYETADDFIEDMLSGIAASNGLDLSSPDDYSKALSLLDIEALIETVSRMSGNKRTGTATTRAERGQQMKDAYLSDLYQSPYWTEQEMLDRLMGDVSDMFGYPSTQR